jgi:hypothetical protein
MLRAIVVCSNWHEGLASMELAFALWRFATSCPGYFPAAGNVSLDKEKVSKHNFCHNLETGSRFKGSPPPVNLIIILVRKSH